MRFHGEQLAMVRTFLLDQHVARLRTSAGVRRLLQRRLVVHHRQLPVAELVHLGEFRFEDCLQDEAMCRLESAIQDTSAAMIASSASVSKALLLRPPLRSSPLPRRRNCPDPERPRRTKQVTRTNDVRPQLGEFSFLIFGKTAEKFLADHEGQNRVAQKLHLLVIRRKSSERRRQRSATPIPAHRKRG